MTVCVYRVEWQDDGDRTHVVAYGERRGAAISKARRESLKHTVAYVVASRGGNACGLKSYGNGRVMDTEGDGF